MPFFGCFHFGVNPAFFQTFGEVAFLVKYLKEKVYCSTIFVTIPEG